MTAPWRGFYLRGSGRRLNLTQIPRSDAVADIGTSALFGVPDGPVGENLTGVPLRGVGRLLATAAMGSALVLLAGAGAAADLPPGASSVGRGRPAGSLQITVDTAPGEETLAPRPWTVRAPQVPWVRLVGTANGPVPPTTVAAPVGTASTSVPGRGPTRVLGWVQPPRLDGPIVGGTFLARPQALPRGRGGVWFQQLETATEMPFGVTWTALPAPHLGSLQVTLDTSPGEELLDPQLRSLVLVPTRGAVRLAGSAVGIVPPAAAEALPAGGGQIARPTLLPSSRVQEQRLWYVVDDNEPRAGQLTTIPGRGAWRAVSLASPGGLYVPVAAGTLPPGAAGGGLPVRAPWRAVGQAVGRLDVAATIPVGLGSSLLPGRRVGGPKGYVQDAIRAAATTPPPGGFLSALQRRLPTGPTGVALWYVLDDNEPPVGRAVGTGRALVRGRADYLLGGLGLTTPVVALPPGQRAEGRGMARPRLVGSALPGRLDVAGVSPMPPASGPMRVPARRSTLPTWIVAGLAYTEEGGVFGPCEMWVYAPSAGLFTFAEPPVTWVWTGDRPVYTFDHAPVVWVYLPCARQWED